jgi:hypothetical protein
VVDVVEAVVVDDDVDDEAGVEDDVVEVDALGLGESVYPRPRPRAARIAVPMTKRRPRMVGGYGCDFNECHRYAEHRNEVT